MRAYPIVVHSHDRMYAGISSSRLPNPDERRIPRPDTPLATNQGSRFTTYESRLTAHGLWWTIPTGRPLRAPATDVHARWSEGRAIQHWWPWLTRLVTIRIKYILYIENWCFVIKWTGLVVSRPSAHRVDQLVFGGTGVEWINGPASSRSTNQSTVRRPWDRRRTGDTAVDRLLSTTLLT